MFKNPMYADFLAESLETNNSEIAYAARCGAVVFSSCSPDVERWVASEKHARFVRSSTQRQFTFIHHGGRHLNSAPAGMRVRAGRAQGTAQPSALRHSTENRRASAASRSEGGFRSRESQCWDHLMMAG